MSALQIIKQKSTALIERHGAEVSACARLAVTALIPGGGLIAEAIGMACDYASDKAQEPTDQRFLDAIGEARGDIEQVAQVVSCLEERMGEVLSQMVMMSAYATPEILTRMCESALATRQDLTGLREGLMGLQPELYAIREQNETLLRGQAFAGDMIAQVRDSLEAALGFCAPLAVEGVARGKEIEFMEAHATFQRALLSGELDEAAGALGRLSALAPLGSTARVCEIALLSVRRDFEGAERVSQTLSLEARAHVLVARMTESVTSLTQVGWGSRAARPERANLAAGQEVGSRGWRLQEQLGRGGMGEVWAVENLQGERGALKMMTSRLSEDEAFVRRFQSEMSALRRARHAAVVELVDWGRDQAGWFLVMELIEGESLSTRLRRGPLSEVEARALGEAVAEGLAACHAVGVVHRDLKPENIMLRGDGTPVLIDFGIAYQTETNSGHTQMATVLYAPPEQLRGDQVGPEADLYALGRTLLECLGGWRGVSQELAGLLERLTHGNPERRGTALEAASSLHFTPLQPPPLNVAGAVWPLQVKGVELKMVYCPPGEFEMGSSDWLWRDERPRHRVTLTRGFWLAQTQVTQTLWERVMGANPSKFKTTRDGATLPVEMVSWFDCVRFCNKLSALEGLEVAYQIGDGERPAVTLNISAKGYRLPTEAEWEYAARAGTALLYAGGDSLEAVAWYGNLMKGSTHDVGNKNANAWGLYDMSGNVWEWCSDGKAEYSARQQGVTDPLDNPPEPSARINRGGAWSDVADVCRVTYRRSNAPESRSDNIGLRLARSLD